MSADWISPLCHMPMRRVADRAAVSGPDCPDVYVSVRDAREFTRWRSARRDLDLQRDLHSAESWRIGDGSVVQRSGCRLTVTCGFYINAVIMMVDARLLCCAHTERARRSGSAATEVRE